MILNTEIELEVSEHVLNLKDVEIDFTINFGGGGGCSHNSKSGALVSCEPEEENEVIVESIKINGIPSENYPTIDEALTNFISEDSEIYDQMLDMYK